MIKKIYNSKYLIFFKVKESRSLLSSPAKILSESPNSKQILIYLNLIANNTDTAIINNLKMIFLIPIRF